MRQDSTQNQAAQRARPATARRRLAAAVDPADAAHVQQALRSGEEQGAYKLPGLHILSEVASALSSDADIEQLLMRFLSTMMRLSGAGAGAVRVLTGDGKHLRLVGSIGLPEQVVEWERITRLDCGVCGQAVCDQTVHNSRTVHLCRKNSGLSFFGERCTNFVAVPLRHKGKTLGVYNLFMFAESAPIPQDVRLFFTSISEHLGMALENARLTRENMRISLMNERQMLSHEIHDSLAQTLAYMNIRLKLLKTAINEGDDSFADKCLHDVDDALKSAYAGLRELLNQFHHRMDPRGLLPALRDLLDVTCKKTDAHVDFINQAQDFDLTPDQEARVFHIVQEALANICKHSQAHNIHLEIGRIDDSCRIIIADDGVGMPTTAPTAPGVHFGLNIMKGRARQLGGQIEFSDWNGSGTRLTLLFPFQPRQEGKVS